MIMKVVAHGQTREQAIGRLHDALAALHIVGITHNTRYLQAVLQRALRLVGQSRRANYIYQQLAAGGGPGEHRQRQAGLFHR